MNPSYPLMTLTRAFAIIIASSSVLSLPNEIRIVPSEYSDGTPIALITCETSVFTESNPNDAVTFPHSFCG